MNTIKLKVRKVLFDNKNINVIRYIINGKDFIELVKKVELPFAKAEKHLIIAGGYEGLRMEEVIYPSEHLLGYPDPSYEYEGKTQLLTCKGCREPGCWPLFAKIKVTKDKVIWSDFEQPHRGHTSHNEWKYDKLGPITFNRREYEEELHRVKKE